MGKEERLIKVLAGLYVIEIDPSRGNDRGVKRSDVNGGILSLRFSGHNSHQLGKDLDELAEKLLIISTPDGNVTRYQTTERGARIAKNMISIWNALRKS